MTDATSFPRACQDFVDAKYALDLGQEIATPNSFLTRFFRYFGRSYPTVPHGYRYAIAPHVFACCSLPFSQPVYSIEIETVQFVDSSLVIGGTYQWYATIGNSSETMERLDALADLPLHSDTAHYARIGDLPLYVALEGKNRVQMYRAANRAIRARVTVTPYPSPDKLSLHAVRPYGLWVLCLHSEDQLVEGRILPFPSVTLPMFKAYGVASGNPTYQFCTLFEWRRITSSVTRTSRTAINVPKTGS